MPESKSSPSYGISNAVCQTGSQEDNKANPSPDPATHERAATPAQALTIKKPEKKKHNEYQLGNTPDAEPLLNPKWLVFSADEGYRAPQYATFSITNTEEKTIAFRLRSRDRLFPQMSHSNGILQPKQSVEVICYIPPYDQWPRDVSEYTGKVHKVVVESLIVPDSMTIPKTPKELFSAVRKLFHQTAAKAPLTRIYLKLKIILPIVAGISPPRSVSSSTSAKV
ncbi:unnamed protein product [Bursaphelenchus xylophilus]|uniref:Major sperm protein n=1 Tax=Bursaphelenchus xylophilus TaxID=6326 RepID=A0A1I7RPK0_BURXY|nr:unnamed protein product [Bursaphelenchus xylophilus]CAG9096149.1 unnamed protein product [Bursaphelenchus xylophilus]